MYHPTLIGSVTLPFRNFIRLPHSLRVFLVVLLTLISPALLPMAEAQIEQSCPSFCDDSNNTASGKFAFFGTVTGTDNTGIGAFTIFDNSTGVENTAIGSKALSSVRAGRDNSASGAFALIDDTTGSFNTAC